MPDIRSPWWLSNFVDCPVSLDGVRFPSVENAYQAAKAPTREHRAVCAHCAPGVAKRIARDRGWVMREDKYAVMDKLLRQKFSREPFRSLLRGYSGELVEWNTWHDNDWGHCTCPRCQSLPHANNLGRLLAAIRDEPPE